MRVRNKRNRSQPNFSHGSQAIDAADETGDLFAIANLLVQYAKMITNVKSVVYWNWMIVYSDGFGNFRLGPVSFTVCSISTLLTFYVLPPTANRSCNYTDVSWMITGRVFQERKSLFESNPKYSYITTQYNGRLRKILEQGNSPSMLAKGGSKKTFRMGQVTRTVTVTVTVTISGDACPLSCASAEAYKLAQCTRPQGWGS